MRSQCNRSCWNPNGPSRSFGQYREDVRDNLTLSFVSLCVCSSQFDHEQSQTRNNFALPVSQRSGEVNDMNEATTIAITGAVRAASNPSEHSPHSLSRFVPRPTLQVVPVSSEAEPDDEQVWVELERMLVAREAARSLHPAGRTRVA